MEGVKHQKWNIVSLLPALLVCVAIFYFSLQRGEASLQSSEIVTNRLYSFFGGKLVLTQAQLDSLSKPVRILAHMAEYGALAVCLAYASTRNGIRRQLRAVYMCGGCLLISFLDEFLQIFVPGRYGDPVDMMIDMIAVVIVSLVVFKLRKTRALPRPEGREGKRRAFLNTALDDVSFEEAVDRIMELAAEKQPHCRMLVTPNADHIIKLEKDAEFAEVYRHADLITADGMPLLWIADSFNCPLREKVSGADLLFPVCERAAKEGRSIFFFGTSMEVIEAASEKLVERYPGLQIRGGYAPPMRFETRPEEVEKAVKAINSAAADILVVGLGAPKSEKFIYNNRKRLKARMALPIGAAIAFAAGNQKRAPGWMQKFGLEWFYRFLQEPGRLFRRYFIEDMQIFFLALKYRDRTVAGYLGEMDEDRDRPDKSE